MKKLITIFGAIAIFFALSLNNFAQGIKGGSRPATVYLNVMINDSVGVQSDGTGDPYGNGTSSVQAVLDTGGNFVFNSGTRTVNFNYSIPQDENNSPLMPDSQTGVKVRTFPINSTGYVPMQNMTVGTSQCLGLGWELAAGDVAGSTREIGYHYFRGVLTNTAFVTVTRSDQDTWTLEPANRATCGGNDDITFDNIARVRDTKTAKGKTTDYDYGRYYMPFKLILTRQ